jgi:hypothetical protein
MAEKTLEDESYCLHAVGVGRTGAGYVDGLLRTGEIEDVLEDPRATFAALVISVGHDKGGSLSAQPDRVEDYAIAFRERLTSRGIPQERFSFESIVVDSPEKASAGAKSAIAAFTDCVQAAELPSRVMVCFNLAGSSGIGMAPNIGEQLSKSLKKIPVIGIGQLPHSGDEPTKGLSKTISDLHKSDPFGGGMIITNTEHSWQRLTAYTDRNASGSFAEIGEPAVRDRFRQHVTNKFVQDAFMRFAVRDSALSQVLKDADGWSYYNVAKFTHPGVQVLPGEALSKWHEVISQWIDHIDDYSLLNAKYRSKAMTVHCHGPRVIGFERMNKKLEQKLKDNFLAPKGKIHEFVNHEFFDILTAYADIFMSDLKPSDLTV